MHRHRIDLPLGDDQVGAAAANVLTKQLGAFWGEPFQLICLGSVRNALPRCDVLCSDCERSGEGIVFVLLLS